MRDNTNFSIKHQRQNPIRQSKGLKRKKYRKRNLSKSKHIKRDFGTASFDWNQRYESEEEQSGYDTDSEDNVDCCTSTCPAKAFGDTKPAVQSSAASRRSEEGHVAGDLESEEEQSGYDTDNEDDVDCCTSTCPAKAFGVTKPAVQSSAASRRSEEGHVAGDLESEEEQSGYDTDSEDDVDCGTSTCPAKAVGDTKPAVQSSAASRRSEEGHVAGDLESEDSDYPELDSDFEIDDPMFFRDDRTMPLPDFDPMIDADVENVANANGNHFQQSKLSSYQVFLILPVAMAIV